MSADQACRLPRAAQEEFARVYASVLQELHSEHGRIEVLLVEDLPPVHRDDDPPRT